MIYEKKEKYKKRREIQEKKIVIEKNVKTISLVEEHITKVNWAIKSSTWMLVHSNQNKITNFSRTCCKQSLKMGSTEKVSVDILPATSENIKMLRNEKMRHLQECSAMKKRTWGDLSRNKNESHGTRKR